VTVGIYIVEHVASGRRYVGKSVNVEKRVREHFFPSQVARSSSYLHSAIAKYGREAFVWRLLEECASAEEAGDREVHWIEALGTRAPGGFNLTAGGEGVPGRVLSEETKEKIRRSNLGQKRSAETRENVRRSRIGKKLSAAHRAAQSVGKMGRIVSEETRQKIRIANMGNKSAAGRVVSAETRAKISAAAKRRHASKEASQ
jgi:group I intron endonuclease